MNSNIKEIAKIINSFKTDGEVYNFLLEILAESEVSILTKRWQILKLLSEGYTQREVASKLNVSLCNVTRGAKILKKDNSVIKKFIGENYEHTNIK